MTKRKQPAYPEIPNHMIGDQPAFPQMGGLADHPYEVGANYFIRTVTHHYTGKLVEVYEHELVLVDAAWIADDGRYANAVAKGEYNEVEPYPNDMRVVIGRGSIIDAVCSPAPLPRRQK